MKGIENLIKNLKNYGTEVCVKEVDKLADETLRLSQVYCPVDTSELLNSAMMKKTKKGVLIKYNAPHATIAHEYPQSRLKTVKNPNVKSQFLRTALVESYNKQFQ